MRRDRTHDFSGVLADYLAASGLGRAGRHGSPLQPTQEDAEWRELAHLAMELSCIPVADPSEAFRTRGYRTLMSEIAADPNRRSHMVSIPDPLPAIFAGLAPKTRVAWVGTLVGISLCLATGGAVLAAGDSLPGDPLYGLKTTVENVRLAVTSPSGDVSLHAHFSQRRLGEIETAVAQGRLDDATRAASGYEEHVGQALQALTATGEDDATARDHLASELVQILTAQTTELDELAGRMPEQMAPAIQRARSTSAEARDAIGGHDRPPEFGDAAGPSSATRTTAPDEEGPAITSTVVTQGLPGAKGVTPAATPWPGYPAEGAAPVRQGTPGGVKALPEPPSASAPQPPPAEVTPAAPGAQTTGPAPARTEAAPPLDQRPSSTGIPSAGTETSGASVMATPLEMPPTPVATLTSPEEIRQPVPPGQGVEPPGPPPAETPAGPEDSQGDAAATRPAEGMAPHGDPDAWQTMPGPSK